uniref:uncharacterized protein LOC118518013 isoform X15 n=1 Tax=Halichoerus grypus TaxID=9711 RepID=UPI0016594CD0|nr:uncharacterized protein LOC118518013 isoform X15 [Halichoerus grypus]
MTWVSELRFLVCTGKITALYEVVVRLPGGDVGFDKGKPVLGSSCCTREPWGAPDHTSRTPQKSLRICQESNFHKGQEFSPVLFTAVFPVPRTAPQRDEEKLITSEGLNNCASPESQGLSGFRLPPGMSLHFQLAGTVTSFPCTHGW